MQALRVKAQHVLTPANTTFQTSPQKDPLILPTSIPIMDSLRPSTPGSPSAPGEY